MRRAIFRKEITSTLSGQTRRKMVSEDIAPVQCDRDSRGDSTAGHAPFATSSPTNASPAVSWDGKQTVIRSRKKWQERAAIVMCFSKRLKGRGNCSASCCSPQCLTSRPSCLLSAVQHIQSLNRGYLLGLSLVVSLYMPYLMKVFVFPQTLLGTITVYLLFNLCSISTVHLHLTLKGSCSIALEQEGKRNKEEQQRKLLPRQAQCKQKKSV